MNVCVCNMCLPCVYVCMFVGGMYVGAYELVCQACVFMWLCMRGYVRSICVRVQAIGASLLVSVAVTHGTTF